MLVARGPAEALEVVAREQGLLRLLIADVVMPGVSGRDLAHQLREVQPRLRVLFISGYAENVLSRGGVLEVGTDLLLKPFTPTSLLARVRAALDRQ